MRIIKVKGLKIIFLLIIIILVSAPHSFAQGDKGRLRADRVQYYREDEFIQAFGNAQIELDDIIVYADQIEIDLVENKLRAFGMVKVKGEDGEFDSKELEYNINSKEGILVESEGIVISDHATEPIRINSSKVKHSPDKSEFVDLTFTACDLDKPHYNFQARSMSIYPGDKVVAYHISLWEFDGRIPILYLPYVRYSLDEDDEQALQTRIGHSRSRGWFIQNTYNYNLPLYYNDGLLNYLAGGAGQLYLDYYTESRFAGGFKHYYRMLEDDNAYLYLFIDEDNREEDKDLSLEIKVERELETKDLERDYTIEYRNHQGDYFNNPNQEDYTLDLDFSQKTFFDIGDNELNLAYTKDRRYDKKLELELKQELDMDKWNNDFELSYNKDNTYDNRFEFGSSFELKTSNFRDRLDLDFEYEFQDRTNGKITDEYNLDLDLGKRWSNNRANRDDHIRLRLDYDSINPFQGEGKEYDEYGFKLDYTNYLSNNLDFDYKYYYNNYYSEEESNNLNLDYDTRLGINYNNWRLESGYEFSDYDQEKRRDDLDWHYDADVKLSYNRRGYKLDLETRQEKTNEGLDYYYLPKLDLEMRMRHITNQSYLRPVVLKLGGFNKYQENWGERRQYGYYNLNYNDNKQLGTRNNINYRQTLQQNFYSTGHLNWWHRSRLRLRTSILENWTNQLNHTYQQSQGEIPDGFNETLRDPENKLTGELKWAVDKSDFNIKTGYDFIEEEFDRLESNLNYNINEHYDIEGLLRYDLNQNHFESFGAKMMVNYNDFEFNTAIIADFDDGDISSLQFENDLDWTFGEDEWEWTIKLGSRYDNEDGEFTRANIAIEKMLHCRKVTLAYDHIKQETWFQYQILAFPQGEFRFGSNEEEGMLYDVDLEGILDEED
ncbi:LPS-assembly protein LptD [Halonatronum saccharophilum]|uniref:LPS-assembly protein LptD n=1 Tax=Halonatronum saccharophilum TaxID=150060 RepID=UPI00048396D9|nr:LPS-assembly protein LptD [Halonatronum saccharophilum]